MSPHENERLTTRVARVEVLPPMRLIYLATALLLLGTGLATAGPLDPKGEEVLPLDLSSAGGPTLFLKCSRTASFTDCGIISVWQQTNPLAGLQTSIYTYYGTPYHQDDNLLS